jgi:predicted lipoprotein with Yx(FWY)xxD motif
MKRRRTVAMVVLAGALLVGASACSSNSSKASSSSSSPATSTSETSSASPSGGSAASGTAALSSATNAKIGQPVLVDANGMTVYLYQPDGSNTTSQVPAGLRALWPPVSAGSATVGTGLDQSKSALESQPDGTNQLDYNGHLLYTYSGDQNPGDANGQGLGGIWFVLSPSGDKISS